MATAKIVPDDIKSRVNKLLESKVTQPLTLEQVHIKASKMKAMGEDLRNQILAPKPRKAAPRFTVGQLAEVCGIDRQRVNYLLTKAELPQGRMDGRIREFELEDVYTWVKTIRGNPPKPEIVPAATLIFPNFKGGSTKTTTAMCVAQGLALRGRKVLCIDLDPQGSLTELCGIYADVEVEHEHTVAPYLESYLDKEPMDSLAYAIQKSYWPGIDIIPSSAALFGAEFNFPAIVRAKPDFPIWTILREGLKNLPGSYDYIVLDTSPSLSYLSVNALMAADSLIMPLVPDALDFISSIQFWGLFSDLTGLFQKDDEGKTYDMINVLLCKVDNSSQSVPIVKAWAQRAYEEWMLTTEIPLSSAVSSGALSFNTVYDQMKGNEDASKKTIDRVRQPFNDICESIDTFYIKKWSAE